MTKKQLRMELKSRLQSMSSLERQTVEASLNEKLFQFLSLNVKTNSKLFWGIYRAFDHEPSLQPLIEKCQRQGFQVQWVFPKIQNDELIWVSPGPRGFEKASFGVEEPILEGAKRLEVQELSGAFIPGLGFDRKGVRLGRGRGYYDRELAKLKDGTRKDQSFLKVGVASQCQLMNEVPCEDHDIKMDVVITDQEILKPETK